MNTRYIWLALTFWFEYRMKSGSIQKAFDYWIEHGVVSGSGSESDCEFGDCTKIKYWIQSQSDQIYNLFFHH